MNGPHKKNPAARDRRAYLKTTAFPTPKRQINYDTINQAALRALPAILARLLPGGKIVVREFVALNPTRADRRTGSFSINLRTGRWADFATGDSGGDVVSLVAYIERLSQAAAAWRLAGMVGANLSNEVRR
jgi:hypothetical protein